MAVALILAAAPQTALAVCAPPVQGATLTPPDQLLGKFPEGNGALVSEVRNIVATNPSSLDAVMALVAKANANQKKAIAAGLGQAAGVCSRPDPDAARRIQEAVLRFDDREFQLAFQAVTGDRQTAAVGGGGAAGGGGGAGGGAGGGGVGPGAGAGGGGASSGFFNTATSSTSNNSSGAASGGGGGASLRSSRSVTASPFGAGSTSQSQ